MGFRYRKLSKNLATGHYENRDQQFKIIFTLVAMMSIQTPIISIDRKKKECLGNLYRQGNCYTQQPVKVYDHDYEFIQR